MSIDNNMYFFFIDIVFAFNCLNYNSYVLLCLLYLQIFIEYTVCKTSKVIIVSVITTVPRYNSGAHVGTRTIGTYCRSPITPDLIYTTLMITVYHWISAMTSNYSKRSEIQFLIITLLWVRY